LHPFKPSNTKDASDVPASVHFFQPVASAQLVVRHCPHASSLQTRGSSGPLHRSSSSNFKLSLPFEQRQAQATDMLAKHPGKLPVIVERADGATGVVEIDRKKFLVPGDMCIWQMESIIRNRLHLPEGQNLFLFVREKIVFDLSPTMADMHAQHADDDGFIYITFKAGMFPSPFSPRGAAVHQLEARLRKQTPDLNATLLFRWLALTLHLSPSLRRIPYTAGRRETACSAGRSCSAVALRRKLTRSSGTCTASTSA
jgi:hypothetical protein